MGARMLPRFWTALASLPGWATDSRDWRQRLGDEWPVVEPLLRGTGHLARAVDCPSLGGDGCPRTVVRLPSGALRGVCGASPAECDPVDLEPHDVIIQEVHRRALCQQLAAAFCTVARSEFDLRARLVRLGDYAVTAGVSADVHLVIVDPRDPLTDEELHAAGVGQTASVLLLPDEAAIPAGLRVRLADRGCLRVALPSAVVAQGISALGLALPREDVLEPVHRALLARAKEAAGPSRVALPVGLRWAQVTFSLLEAEILMVSAGGRSHRLDPGELGMRNAKNGKPTLAWNLLVEVIAAGGTLPVCDMGDVKKHKQSLTQALQATLRIQGDPLRALRSPPAYEAAFICRDDRPTALRRTRLR